MVTTLSALSGGGDLRLREAADIIAAGARSLASSWSRTVPQSIRVSAGAHVAIISASAPVARPAELRLKHPLFGDREHWYPPPGEPFLSPAAIARSDAALVQYAKKIDDMARKAGFR
jgi:hypothetical protein